MNIIKKSRLTESRPEESSRSPSPTAANAAAASQSQLSPFHFSDDGIEVDYEPDSGMDTDDLAEHYSPLQQPVPPGAVPHHAHTPPVWHHEMEGALPAGADYAHLGLQYEVPEWYHQ